MDRTLTMYDTFQISDEWVMTAAHCVADADAMTVYLGAHNVKEETEEGTMLQIKIVFFI